MTNPEFIFSIFLGIIALLSLPLLVALIWHPKNPQETKK